MKPYLSNYNGRIYTFTVIDIPNPNLLILQNNENYRTTQLNPSYVYAPDYIEVGDTITRQYTREGVGLRGRYIGGYSSRGETQYVDITSVERWKKEHPFLYHKNLIILLTILLICYIIS